jgi:hypothetical protein
VLGRRRMRRAMAHDLFEHDLFEESFAKMPAKRTVSRYGASAFFADPRSCPSDWSGKSSTHR